MRCPECKEPMEQLRARYAPCKEGLMQTFAEYECECGVKLTVSDLKTVSDAQSEGIKA